MSNPTTSESTVAFAGVSRASPGEDTSVAATGMSLWLTLTMVAVMVLAGFNSRKRRRPPNGREPRSYPRSHDDQSTDSDDDNPRRY